MDITLTPRFLVLSISVFFLLFILYRNKSEINIHTFPIIISYFAFTIWVVLSILWSTNKAIAITEASKQFLYFSFFIICQQYLQNDTINRLKRIIIFVSVTSIINSAFIVWEISNLESYSRISVYEINFINGHKNLSSSFTFLCLIFSVLGIRFFEGKKKIALISLTIMQLIIIALLQSRAVWFAILCFVFVSICVHISSFKKINFSFKKILIAAGVITLLMNIAIFTLLPNFSQNHLFSFSKASEYNNALNPDTYFERTEIWSKTFQLIQQNPIAGVGANNWRIMYLSNSYPNIYKVQDLNVIFQRPHNDFLWIMSEYGVIGFSFFYFFIISIALSLFAIYNSTKQLDTLFLISGILSYLLISFFDFPKERIEHNLLIILLLCYSALRINHHFGSGIKMQLKLGKKSLLFLLPISFFVVIVSLLNIKGEYYTRKMHTARAANNNKEIIKNCYSAISFAYNVDATSIPLLWYCGNANVESGYADRAFKDFVNAYRICPFNPHVINDLASAYYLKAEEDSALKYYLLAAKINPRFDDPRLNLAVVYYNQENYSEALKWIESIAHDSELRVQYKNLIQEKIHQSQ